MGDTTPEAYFEIASSSGVVASISNIFSINATTTSSSFNGSVNTTAGIHAQGDITGSNLSGTNTGNVTLSGTPDYITLSGQVITRNKLDISDDTNATGGIGVDISTNDFTFDSTEIEATTWGAGANATNVWTFNLSSGDPTLTWTTSGASLSLNFEALGYASASAFKGSAFSSASCNSTSQKLLWNTDGTFSCGTDFDTATSVGNVADGLDIANSGGVMVAIASLTFDAGHFTFSNTASDGYVRLDWGNGGPASLSQDETVTGFWEFRNGASFSNDVEFYDRTATNPMFAIFSSASSGRFGLGDTTPEAYFEIASSSGVVASISNIFSINATTTSSSFNGSVN
ncbi:MAG: hypothetical protein Q7K33_01420, partial [Candidatus Berkelbacteria bacterium]|nr:hypothetical protein [Candidatus Berkelbacteria bacterium]